MSLSFHSSHKSEKEKALLRVVAAVAMTSGFGSDGMNRPQPLLLGVGMNGRRVPSYGDTTKISPWNSSMHSRGGGAGTGLLQQLLQLQLV